MTELPDTIDGYCEKIDGIVKYNNPIIQKFPGSVDTPLILYSCTSCFTTKSYANIYDSTMKYTKGGTADLVEVDEVEEAMKNIIKARFDPE